MSIGPLQVLVDRLRQAGPGGASGLSDGELLERWARDRDEAAFELLVWRHGRLVLSVCRRLLRHPQDVEDAFQATFLVLVRKARSIVRRQALASWLHTVATRIALSACERRAREASWAANGVEALPARPTPDGPDAEFRAVLDEEVGRLSEKYRIVFVLCCLEGKTDEAAARELGCPLGTVLSRLSRARRRLRERLARRGIEPTAALPALAEALSLPAGLPETTVQAALTLAAGAPAVTPAAAALMEGVLHAMFLTKVKVAAVTVLAFALLGVGGMTGYHGLSAQQGVAGDGPGAQGTNRKATTSRPPTAQGAQTGLSEDALKADLEMAKAAQAAAQATVKKLEKALKDAQDKKATATRAATGMMGGMTRRAADPVDAEVAKLKVAAAKAEHDSAVASLDSAKRRLANAERASRATKGAISEDDLDILKTQFAKAKAEVDLKRAHLQLAELEYARVAKAAPKQATGNASLYGRTTKAAPTLESRVKALEEQLQAMQKELAALKGKGTSSSTSPSRPSRR